MKNHAIIKKILDWATEISEFLKMVNEEGEKTPTKVEKSDSHLIKPALLEETSTNYLWQSVFRNEIIFV